MTNQMKQKSLIFRILRSVNIDPSKKLDPCFNLYNFQDNIHFRCSPKIDSLELKGIR